MTITLTCNNTNYIITQDASCCTIKRLGTNGDPNSPNYGKETETDLKSYPTTVGKAVQTIIRDQIGNSDDTVTLQQYVDRLSALNKEMLDQLELAGI